MACHNQPDLTLAPDQMMPAKTSAPPQESARIREENFRDALLRSAIGVAVTDREGRFVEVNEAFCRITARNKDELRLLDCFSLTHPEDRDRSIALAQQMSAGELPSFLLEERYIRKDGSAVWVRISTSVLEEREGKPEQFIALVEDISESKRKEEALAEKEWQLGQAQHLAQIGSWNWDPETDAVAWSDELFRRTGLDPKQPAPNFREHARLFTLESWERLSKSVENTLRTGIPYELELDAILPNGSKASIVARGEAVKDADGRVIQLRGTIQDVSERKRTERLVHTSEEKFAKLFQSSPVAMTLVTAKDGRQIAVNDAYERITGRTRDEAIGRTYIELGHWDDPCEREKLVARLMAGEPLRNVECRFRNKRGELFFGLLSADKIDIEGETCLLTAVADITDWKRAEQALRSSQAKLALHFEQTMVGVIEWDRSGCVNAWNSAAERIFGYTRQEALGRNARELIIPPEILADLRNQFCELLDQTGGHFSINENVTKDSRRIFCEWFNTPLVGEDGNVIGVMSLVHDITAQKKAQADLAASEATLSALIESTDDMIWTVDADRFGFITVNGALARYFARRRGIDIRKGMTPDELSPEHAPWWNAAYRRAREAGSYEIDYEVPSTDRIVHLSFNPLMRDGQIFGISVFGKDITDRKRAQEALQASEVRYRSLVESSHDWVWEVNADGIYTFVGPQCREILGYEPEEIVGKTPFDLMPPDEARRVAEVFGAIAAERKPFRLLENANLHKDGHLVILETNGVPVFDSTGGFQGYRGMDRDITQRKRAEEALRQSESKFSRIFRLGPGVMALQTFEDGRFIEFNDAGLRAAGYMREEVIGRSAADLGMWFDQQERLRVREALLATGRVYQEKHRFRTKAGEVREGLVSAELIDVNGQKCIISAIVDLTEHAEAERAVQKSEEKFSKAFQSSPAMMCIVRLEDQRYIEVNHAFERHTGYDRQEIIGRTLADVGLWTGPQNLQQFLQLLAEGSYRNIESEFCTKSGELRIGLLSGDIIDVAGSRCLLVVAEDITEWKRAEDALRESEKQYRQLFDQMISGLMVCEVLFDENGQPHDHRLVRANPAFERLTGRRIADEVGKTGTEMSIKWPEDVRRRLYGVAISGEPIEYERFNETLNRYYDTRVFSPRPGLFAHVFTDITARKQAENALRESEEQFRTIADNLPGVVYQFYARDNGEWGVYFVHERATDVLGLSPEPLASWLHRFGECIAPEDKERIIDSIKKSVASETPWSYEGRFIKPSGQEMYVRGASRPQRHGSELVYYGILLDITDRRRAEKALRESEARLRMAAEAGRMYAFEWYPATDVVLRSAECVDILGLTPATMYKTGKESLRNMHPLDRESYQSAIAMLTPDEPSFRVAYRFLRPDGATVWLEDRVRALFDERGSLLRTIGMTTDITARKEAEQELVELSGRLINALEEERSRIARELHDGVSQALAIISIELGQTSKKAAGTAVGDSIEKLYDKVQNILSDISSLSHQLHPSTLKYLGFSPAIRELCREASETRGIKVEFSQKDVAVSLPPDVALCLYRVTQEALQNIAKHSHSKAAWVQLTGSPRELRLCIWDEGVGFNTETAHRGLGLISMRERLRLVGGTLHISSRAPSGTHIEATVPLPQER